MIYIQLLVVFLNSCFLCAVLGRWLPAFVMLQFTFILFISPHLNLNSTMIVRTGYKKKQMRLVAILSWNIESPSESFCIYEIVDLVHQLHNKAEILFSEVCNVLHQISEKVSGPVLQEGGNRVSDFRNLVAELKGMLLYEKEEFEVLPPPKTKKKRFQMVRIFYFYTSVLLIKSLINW